MRSLIALLVILFGVAGPAVARADTLESVNRSMFDFNNATITWIIDPLSEFVRAWVPQPVRQAGSNVYENITEPEFVVAHMMVGDSKAAQDSLRRLILNSTLGLGGLFDVATGIGFRRKPIEFGAALCQAGLSPGDYLILPLVGPTNVTTASAIVGFIVGGWYALSMVSAALATADLVIDMSASAASLRYAGDAPPDGSDPYLLQRGDYWSYMRGGCAGEEAGKEAGKEIAGSDSPTK
jgi:phospholipid-binding lipoprotein MlaA